jgi:ribosomal protein L37AE/L43A
MAQQHSRHRSPMPRQSSSPKAIAGYLVAVKPLLSEVTEARRTFIRHIGLLLEEARSSGRMVVVQAAGRIGRDEGHAFRSLKQQLERVEAPPACDPCHRAILQWVDLHVRACQVMVDVGQSADLTRLHETQSLLGDARQHAQTFNGEYTRLVADVRARVKAAQATQRRQVRQPVR